MGHPIYLLHNVVDIGIDKQKALYCNNFSSCSLRSEALLRARVEEAKTINPKGGYDHESPIFKNRNFLFFVEVYRNSCSVASSPPFGWVGIFAGVGGYLTGELEGVIRAIPQAWRRATSWKPDKERWKNLARYATYWFIFTGSISVIVSLSLFTLLVVFGVFREQLIVTLTITMVSIWFSASLIPTLILTLCFLDAAIDQYSAGDTAREFAVTFNLITIFKNYILKGIYCLIIRAPSAGAVARRMTATSSRFFYHFFRLIHSERRTLAGVYIAFGVAIGYLVFGNAIAGGMAASILAYAGFEIISKRILKVIPIRNGS